VIEDLADRYHEYLERFAREVGDIPIGGFAKHASKLIKKLSFDEFSRALIQYLEIVRRYEDTVAQGDTINDVVIKVMRDQAAALVLKPPA
jgi:hypothetical protein